MTPTMLCIDGLLGSRATQKLFNLDAVKSVEGNPDALKRVLISTKSSAAAGAVQYVMIAAGRLFSE